MSTAVEPWEPAKPYLGENFNPNVSLAAMGGAVARQHRLECLKLALDLATGAIDADTVVRDAAAFYAFVSGESK